MSRLLVDTNVALDVLLNRQPHAKASGAVWNGIENGKAEGLLAAHAVTTIHYVVAREMGSHRANRVISAMLRVFGVAAVNRKVIDDAIDLGLPDFEDAVTAAAARQAGCDCLVTRDPKGFRKSPVQALTPDAAIELMDRQST